MGCAGGLRLPMQFELLALLLDSINFVSGREPRSSAGPTKPHRNFDAAAG